MPADHLLGGHVVQRAELIAGSRDAGIRRAGEAEVEDLDGAGNVEDHVGRLDIAMDDALRVGEVQARAHVFEDRQPVGERQRRPPANQLLQRLARHVLHGDERPAVVLADIEDRHDVGMAKAPGGARLAREPLARRLVVDSLLEQLDGDRAIDRGIAGEVEGAHAAVGNQPDDAIPSDRDGGRRGGMGIGHRVTAQVSGEGSSI